MRICFFGDSFVNGTGDEACLGWVGRIGAQLRSGGVDVTIYNLGIRRDTSSDVRARWRTEAERRLEGVADGRLVFSFGTNDCVEEDGGARVSPAESRANAEAILHEASARWPTLMVGPVPVGDAAAGVRIAALADAFGAVATELGVPFIPVHAAVAASPVWRDEVAVGDGAHPGAGGYGLLAEEIARSAVWRRFIGLWTD